MSPASSNGLVVPARHQPDLPLDRLHPHGSAGRGGRRDGRRVRGRRPRRAWPAPSSWRAWSRRTRRRAAASAPSRSPCSRRRKRSAAHSLSGAVVNPAAFRELFPELKDADFPFRAPVGAERVYLLTERPRAAPAHAAHHAATTATTWPRSARSCAGWARRPKAWASTCSPGFPAGRAARRGRPRARRAHHAERPQARRPARQRLHAADRHHGQGDRALRGHARRR